MPYSLRTYTPADRAACLAVFDSNTPDYFRECERTEFEGFLDRLPCPYFVVEDDEGHAIGCGGYAPERGRLCWGMVARQQHSRGAGRFLLMERLRHWYRHHGPARVSLSTSQHSAGFFRRAGFVLRAVTEDGHAPGLHCCEMELELDGAWLAASGDDPGVSLSANAGPD